jgi:hypothetical protein
MFNRAEYSQWHGLVICTSIFSSSSSTWTSCIWDITCSECITNTAPLSPQVLAALVSQLRSGSTSLLVRTVEGDSKQQDIKKEESVADMVTRAVEAMFTEELEVKPVEGLAEMAEVDKIPDSCTNRPVWWSQCNRYSCGNSMSDTSNLSDDEMEDIVMKLRQHSKNQVVTVSKSEESDYDESEDADQELCIDESIISTAESYWSSDQEFTLS